MKISNAMNWIKLCLSGTNSKDLALLSMLRSIPQKLDLIGIVVMAFVLAYGRWHSIVYPFPLNPDEGQAAANALRIKSYGFNWDALDGSTNGPLDSLIVSWPHIFGLDTTLNTTRLTGCILLFLVCTCVYFSIKIVSGAGFAALFVLPLVVFYSFTKNPEFLHYSSELLPLFLLVAANFIVIQISLDRDRPHEFKFLLLAFLLGAVPFAKLQATPIAVAIGLYALILVVAPSSKWKMRNLISLFCGGLAPAIVILVPLLVSGHFQDFWNSYIVWGGLYIRSPSTILGIYSMVARDAVLRYVTYFIFFVGIASLLHSSLIASNEHSFHRAAKYDVIYMSILVVIAFWAISIPGKPYLHYLMFFPPFVVITFAYLARVFVGSRTHVIVFVSYYTILAAFFIILSINNGVIRDRYDTILKPTFMLKSPHILSWLPIPSKHLLVWGWMPQWYVLSGLTPATRETQIYSQVMQTDLTEYFRSRFMSDIKQSSPEVIIDAVAGKSFHFNNPATASPDNFPAFASFLSQNYSQLPSLVQHPDCPKVYVKNEYRKLIDQSLIIPASVTATETFRGKGSVFDSANLFDNSVTEDTCIDYWLLPNWKLGGVRISFSKTEFVSGLMLLKTQNSIYLDRATRDIEVRLLESGAVVEKRQLTMSPYPYWTAVKFDRPVKANHLDVDVLSFYGRGGGLNEIKIFRAGDPGKGGP